jgi:hypothetical protein
VRDHALPAPRRRRGRLAEELALDDPHEAADLRAFAPAVDAAPIAGAPKSGGFA